jgi:hypothetical protein
MSAVASSSIHSKKEKTCETNLIVVVYMINVIVLVREGVTRGIFFCRLIIPSLLVVGVVVCDDEVVIVVR